MGSGTSKDSTAAADFSSSSSGGRCLRSRVFSASCFSLPSTFPEDPDDDEEEENGGTKDSSTCFNEIEIKSAGGNNERSRKLRTIRHRKMPPLALCDIERNGDDQESSSASQIELGASSSSNCNAANSSNRSQSLFGFIANRIGFRLSRTVSLGSSRAQSLFSENNRSVPNNEVVDHVRENRNENEENITIGTNYSQDNASIAAHSSHRNDAESGNEETRHYNRRIGPQEPLEGSVRFSRTLSVGRLRDRVLRRTSSSAGIFDSALLEDRAAMGYNGQVSERIALGGRGRVLSSSSNEVWPDYLRNHPYHTASMTDSSYDSENGSSQLREGNNHDLLEHRSAFLERRRRIRSQVRALQRLGSRFENLSGHERSCILSGQYRTGRCTCRASNRTANSNDETGTRASISRIVMLAEALFEVLDEIHQQSAALSSRPSFSSSGSVPAPKDVVECMPVKVYIKPQKHQNEEAAQCYICLVEYEDGDFIRTLPCNHEFHRNCIDKWLKEIHRVCPLCRGDVCRSEALGTDKIS